MLFNSVQFFIFFIIVYSLYLLLNHRWQNRMLLFASYWFYGAWDWRFLSLIWVSTFIDYWCGQRIADSPLKPNKKKYLFISIASNMLILGFFKYFNFFASGLCNMVSVFGLKIDSPTLSIILPVGISFYTFQSMSYTIDIYYEKLKPQRKFADFALFVAFFPQLVAGPIERAKHLLPQIEKPRIVNLEQFYAGCYLIFWGMFQKVFVADNLAPIVDSIFSINKPYHMEEVLLGAYAFAFQIFCDFAGYSNIARGLSKCMGFDIMNNFNMPYFATNPQEFWKRWHISLSTWLRDYLYIPLGGNRDGLFKTLRNLMLTMLLGGLWHGAAWTFVLWGAYHGLLLMTFRYIQMFKSPVFLQGSVIKPIWKCIKVIIFFHLVCYGWILFRAQSLEQIIAMTSGLTMRSLNLNIFELFHFFKDYLFYVWLLIFIQLFKYRTNDIMAPYKWHWSVKAVFYYVITILIIIYGVTDAKDFIYFQF